MGKKKITIEISDNQYKHLVKVLAVGEFAIQGHILKPNKQITQMISAIFAHAKEFNCEHMVHGPLAFGDGYEIDVDYMSELIDEIFDVGEVQGEEDIRFMLKSSETV
ncbi:MAG: hypothetical protein PHW82_10655 [Bacteroidales bacterium]|nr:hypothetical protein [Bacteroidales bacterium]